jgi:hypothetical protein
MSPEKTRAQLAGQIDPERSLVIQAAILLTLSRHGCSHGPTRELMKVAERENGIKLTGLFGRPTKEAKGGLTILVDRELVAAHNAMPNSAKARYALTDNGIANVWWMISRC